MNRLESIQHLRGIAALLVVFVHFPTPLARFCGSIGVDIFFFISGFIIFVSIEKGHYYDRPLTFLKKRLLRILPLYFLATTLFIVMDITLNRFVEQREVFSPVDMSFETVWKSYLLIPIVDDGVYKDPLVFLGWSLSFEMLFYILTFLFLVIFRRKFFIPLLCVLLASGFVSYIIGNFKNVYLDFLTSPFLLYFPLGMIFGKYHNFVKQKISSFVEPILFVVLYVFFVVMTAKDGGYVFEGMPREFVLYNGKLIPRILIWGVPSLILLISYFTLASKYNISNSFLSKLGDRSYSIYLLQVFFIYFLYENNHRFNRSEKVALSMLLIIALVWISGFSYKYFEKKFHR